VSDRAVTPRPPDNYRDLVGSFAPAEPSKNGKRTKRPKGPRRSQTGKWSRPERASSGDESREPGASSPVAPAAPASVSAPSRRSNLQLLLHQTRWAMVAYLRNPVGTFFTVALPIILLVLFVTIFGNEILPNGVRAAIPYVPGLITLSIVSSTAINLSVTMSISRERGLLRRVRGTPLPPWIFVAAQALTGMTLSTIMSVVIIIFGRVVYGIVLPTQAIPSVIISVMIGSLAFCAVGLAITTMIVSEESAPAIVNAIFLPLYFISDVVIPGQRLPSGLKLIGDFFPVRHFSVALQSAFDPRLGDAVPFPWQNWLFMIAWGLACAAITVKWFSWSPRRG
jgi:ABC-2 type transport system permease protein